MHRERNFDALPVPAQAPGGGVPGRYPGGRRGGRVPVPDGRDRSGRRYAGAAEYQGRLRPGAEMRGLLPDRAGTGDRMPALRAGRTGPPDPAGDRLPVRHQPVLRIPPRLM